MTNEVLVLGAAGRCGRASVEAFRQAGWTVRAQVRPGRAAPGGCAVFACDATDAEALSAAAMGVDVIVHALNPPYSAWARESPRLTRAVIAAARASGATVMIPGNVYNYGAELPEVLDEGTPHRAGAKKGRLRIEMEAAFRASGLCVVILRAGDFLEGAASGNWFDSVIAKGVQKGRVVYPGPLDRAHAWAYLPDFARALTDLAAMRASLPRFIEIGFPGFTLSGHELTEAIAEATGLPMRNTGFPWWAMRLAGVVWPMGRELAEMAYLWRRPHRIDGAKFSALLPDFRPTDLKTAMRDCVRLAEIHPDQPVVGTGGALAANQAV